MKQKNDEKIDELEETKSKKENASSSIASFKEIAITEMTRIVKVYREKMFESGDTALIDGMNKKTDINNVVNHIMNNLTAKRIWGGSDESVYEYIHEYYVDKFDVVEDNWSSFLRPVADNFVKPKNAKQKARTEEREKITDEMRTQFYEEALKNAQEAARLKAEAKVKADEEKRKAKEKAQKEAEKAKKEAEKEEKAKLKALEESKKPKQISLFDF